MDLVKTLKRNELETLMDFAKYDMSVSKTAKETFFHRHTIDYRLNKVKEKTGLDPYKFYDLVKLMRMLGEEDGYL